MSKYRFVNRTGRSVLALAFLLLAAPFVTAQVTTGNLQGVVLDPNKAAVAGATVKLTNTETGIGKTTTTNEEGLYRFTFLLPGDRYKLEITAQGFAGAAVENVAVRLGVDNSADVMLSLTQITGEVVVTDETQLINATQSQLSTNYNAKQIEQLPFNGSIDQLALLTPGVAPPESDTDFTNGQGISANGNRPRSNNFQIDGQNNNDISVGGPAQTLTNQEAVAEYQVITNNFSAEFGRNSGAQINVITKSGTNEFHGSLFEFHQNAPLNARDNIEKQNQRNFGFLAGNGFSQFAGLAERYEQPAPFSNNRFGGSLGGPVKKNKAFFFFTYQGDIFRGETQANTIGSTTLTPTAEAIAFAAGRFPGAPTAQLGCNTSGCGPASVRVGQLLIAPPTVDTDSDGIVDSFVFGPGNSGFLPVTPGFLAPLATTTRTAGGPASDRVTLFGGNAVRIYRADSDQHTVNAKVDYNVTDRDSVVVSYNYDRATFPQAGVGRSVGGFFLDFDSDSNKLASTYRRTLSAQTVNEARFNFSRLNVNFGDTAVATPPEVGFSGTGALGVGIDDDDNLVASSFGLSAFGTPNSFPQSRVVTVYQFQDTVTATRGNHGLKFGADITRSKSDDFLLFNFLGSFTFSGSLSSRNTGGTRPNGTFFDYTTGLDLNALGVPGFSFENFLLNRPQSISFALGDPKREIVQNDAFFFAQDDWRVRPNLTLNFGLRYQISSQPFNSIIGPINEREADPNRAIFNTDFPLELRTGREIPVDRNNFGPHVGFAYSPNFNLLGDRFRDGRTVLRGNFNVTYDSSFFNIVNFTATTAPFAGVGTITQRPGLAGNIPFPTLPSTRADLARTPGTRGGDPRLFDQSPIDPNFHNPYTMAWSFGLQQEVFKNSVLEVRYVGNHSVGQFQLYNSNPRIDFLNEAGASLFNDPGRFTNGLIGQSDLNPNLTAAGNGNGRVNRNYGLVTTTGNGAQSVYHGMQARFDTRFNRYLTGGANYSFSRTIDNVSEIVPAASNLNNSQNPLDLGAGERGLSAFHSKHVFSANALYELPFYRDQRGWAGKLLGGYQINAIVLARSGRPYTPFQALSTFDPSFNSSLRPYNGSDSAPVGTIAFSSFAYSLLGDPEVVPPGSFIVFDTRSPGTPGRVVSGAQAFEQARLVYNDFGLLALLDDDPRGSVDFYQPEAFLIARSPYGIGRNTFFGETFATVNASVFKTTRISEGKSIEFRAEAFNLLNHRNFGIPDPFAEDAFNGRNLSSSFQNPGFNNGGNRSVRFGIRLLF